MRFTLKTLFICVMATLCSKAMADNKELTAAPVEISAARIKNSITHPDIESARDELNKTAGGTTIVDANTIREGRVSNYNDSLGMAAGVYVQSRFGAEESRLSIRGSGIQRTFHGRGIKLMQDGIPVNLADGSFDFTAIDPLATSYIEVFRGANALQYGASNLGGAVNFVSPTGYTAPRFEVRAEGGSFGYNRLGIATGGVVGDLDYYLSASQFGTNGYRDDSQQDNQRINANVGYKISDNIETRFFMGYTTNNSNLPGNLTKSQLRSDPGQSQNSANPGDPILAGTGKWRRDIDLWRIANKTTFQFDNTTLELGAFYSNKELYHPIVDLAYLSFLPFPPFSTGTFATLGMIDQKSEDYGLSARLKHQNKLFGLNNEVIIGFNPSYGEINDKRYRNINGRRGALTNQAFQTAYNYESYAENRLSVTDAATLVVGLQHTYAKRSSDDKFVDANRGDESFSQSYSQTSPKLGFIYQLAPRAQVFANVSRSFEPPSFGEMVNITIANSLRAQKGTTYEIGTRGNSTYVDWDVAVYYAKLKNELLAASAIAGASETVNADRTVHSGLEMGLTARLPLSLEYRQNLLINHFKFDNDTTFGDNKLPAIQRALLRGELLYRKNKLYFGPTFEISPERYAVDFAETHFVNPYSIWGLKLGQQFDDHWSWFVEGRNLGNRKYAATTDITKDARDPAYDGRSFLPGDGRSIYAGVQWRY